jgi:hypothetical protein
MRYSILSATLNPSGKSTYEETPERSYSNIVLKDETCHKLSTAAIETNLEEILGIKVTLRPLIYIEKRLGELNFEKAQDKTLQ